MARSTLASFIFAAFLLTLLAAEKIMVSNSSFHRGYGRILGGTAATVGQYPFLVYVESTLPDFVSTKPCGGVVLNSNHVLTAAQCIVLAAKIKIVAGVQDPTDAAAQVSYGRPIIHPNYRRNFQIHDIAIIRLLIPLRFDTGTVFPIRILKSALVTLDKLSLRTVGWGPADASTTIQTTSKAVDLVQLTRKECTSKTAHLYIVYPAMTSCLDNELGAKGFCYGDAGGPVLYQFPKEASYTLVGILSEYLQCPNSLPMSYTRIGHYYGWIKKHVYNLDT